MSGGNAAAAPGESRALVVLAPPSPSPTVPAGYRQSPIQVPLQVPFLAHLLAVKGQHAQTRERRRADPHEALAAYRATANLVR